MENREFMFSHHFHVFAPYECLRLLKTWREGGSRPGKEESCWHNLLAFLDFFQLNYLFGHLGFKMTIVFQFKLRDARKLDALCRSKQELEERKQRLRDMWAWKRFYHFDVCLGWDEIIRIAKRLTFSKLIGFIHQIYKLEFLILF